MDDPLSSGGATQDHPDAPVNRAVRHLPSAVFDGFLPARDADALLAFALEHQGRFKPATVIRAGGTEVDSAVRRSFDCHGPLDWAGAVDAGIRARIAELAAAVGIAPFAVAGVECTLSAYRDGSFYTRHIDTVLGAERQATDRALTAVFYVNREPAGFTGGELEIFPLTGAGRPRTIAPRHNRLAVFPAFAQHRVTTTRVPGDAFADARFSVNCWVHRARD
jgi:hypothetical protein